MNSKTWMCTVWRVAVGVCLLMAILALAIHADEPLVGHVIVPLRDARSEDGESESVEGLGSTLASELTALFIDHLPEESEIRILEQDVITMALDEAGMEQMGLITRSQAAEIGNILGADYVWYGSYSIYSGQITMQLALWSLHTGAAVSGMAVQIDKHPFVEDIDYIRAIACVLFQEMYKATTGSECAIGCPSITREGIPLPRVIVIETPQPIGDFLLSPRVLYSSVKLSAVNNVVERARQTQGLYMKDIRWSPVYGLRAGYSFASGLEGVFSFEYLGTKSNAGPGDSTSVAVSSTAFMGGLAYHLRIAGIEIMLEGRGGWQAALLVVNDPSDVLDCPDQVAGSGIGFEFLASLRLPLLPGVTLHGQVGYRGADLSTATMRLPQIDLTGIAFGIGLDITFLGGWE